MVAGLGGACIPRTATMSANPPRWAAVVEVVLADEELVHGHDESSIRSHDHMDAAKINESSNTQLRSRGYRTAFVNIPYTHNSEPILLERHGQHARTGT